MPANGQPYLDPSLRDRGYVGVTGTTPYRPATPEQVQQIEAMREAARSHPVHQTASSSAIVINVNFDGTHNNGQFPRPGESPTNIYSLTQLQQAHSGPDNTIYLPGPGAQMNPAGATDANGSPLPYTQPSAWDALPMNAGRIVNANADSAYASVSRRVTQILADNPDAEIVFTVSGYSRGAASALVFLNELHDKGIEGLIPPGSANVAQATLFDPVLQADGVRTTTVPPGLANPPLVLVSEDPRYSFALMQIDGEVRVIRVPGDHASVGGGYNPDGISAVTLEMAVGALEAQGIPVGPIPEGQRPNPDHYYLHDASTDNYGNERWSTYEGGRLFEGAGRGDRTVDDWAEGRGASPEWTPPDPAAGEATDYRVPLDPADPDGPFLVVREVVDRSGASTVLVFDEDGHERLRAGPGDRLGRDPDTGLITVTDASGGIQASFDPSGPPPPPASDADHGLAGGPGHPVDRPPADRPDDPREPHPEASLDETGAGPGADGAGLAAGLAAGSAFLRLNDWASLDDQQRLDAALGVYRQVNALEGGSLGAESGLGSMDEVATIVSFWSAVERGDPAQITLEAIRLADAFGLDASREIASCLGLGDATAGLVPGLQLAIAIDAGDVAGIVSGGLNLYGALTGAGWTTPVAMMVGVVCSLIDDEDPPPVTGLASAGWSEDGHLAITAPPGENGGDRLARDMLTRMAEGAASLVSQQMPGWTLVPDGLPRVSVGMYQAGGLTPFALRWTDEQGQEQVRYYDEWGHRGWRDDSPLPQGPLWAGTEDDYPPYADHLSHDFMRLAQHYALAPDWQAEGLQQHWVAQAQAGVPIDERLETLRERPLAGALWQAPAPGADGGSQSLAVLTLGGAAGPAREVLVNLDADAFLERARWIAPGQALMGVDLDRDGLLQPRELLGEDLRGLDTNHDGRIDARDPAFHALRLWIDVEGDANSRSGAHDETCALADTGLVALLIQPQGIGLEWSDGRVEPAGVALITGETLGRLVRAGQGDAVGITEWREQADGSIDERFHSLNTRQHDDQVHEGEDVRSRQPTLVRLGDGRLVGRPVESTQAQDRRDVTAGMIRATQGHLFSAEGSLMAVVALGLSGAAAAVPVGVSAGATMPTDRDAPGAPGQPLVLAPPRDIARTEPTTPGVLGSLAWGDSGPGGWRTEPVTPPGSGARGAPAPFQGGLVAGEGLVQPPGGVVHLPTTELATLPGRSISLDLPAFQLPAGGLPVSVPPAPPPVEAGDTGTGQGGEPVAAPPAPTAPPPSPPSPPPPQPSTPPPPPPPVDVPDPDPGPTPEPEPEPLPPPPNRAPEVRGEAVSTDEDTILLFDPALLLANDRDPDGDALAVTAVDAVLHGSVRVVTGDDGVQRIEFTPDPGYAGPAGFRYVVSDGSAAAHGEVQIEVRAVNDAPLVAGEVFEGLMDTPCTFTPEALLANDTDAETPGDLHIVGVEGATHGRATLTAGGVVFEPEPGYAGPAGFTYLVADGDGATAAGRVQLDLARTNHAPRAADDSFAVNEDPGTVVIGFDQLLANDSDPDTPVTGERLTIDAITPRVPGAGEYRLDIEARTVLFVPARDYHGPADFTYRAIDGRGGSVEATAFVTVHPVNDAPVVLGDDPAPKEPTPWGPHRGRFLATDVDGPGPITWELVHQPDRGFVSLNTSSGDWLYDPSGWKGGQATFTVAASDGVNRTLYHMTVDVGTYGYPFVDSSSFSPHGKSGPDDVDVQAADLARQAQVFLQWAVMQPPAGDMPLAFVPLGEDPVAVGIDTFLPGHEPAATPPGRPA